MQHNVDLIKSLYEIFKNKDYEGIRLLLDVHVEWTQMDGFPGGGKYLGANNIIDKIFSGFHNDWTNWKAVVNEYLDAGNSVIAVGYYEGVYKDTGKSVKADFAHWYIISNGKIIKFKQYTDTAQFVNAMQSNKK